jgi:hypothetical protein
LDELSADDLSADELSAGELPLYHQNILAPGDKFHNFNTYLHV